MSRRRTTTTIGGMNPTELGLVALLEAWRRERNVGGVRVMRKEGKELERGKTKGWPLLLFSFNKIKGNIDAFKRRTVIFQSATLKCAEYC